jgi:archaemetzincin
MPGITLLPIGNLPQEHLSSLGRKVQEVFRTTVALHPLHFDPARAFDAYRNQYNSTVLLSLLLNTTNEQEGRILGVTACDLFVPVLTFVFGEAQLSGRVAVVSSFRLRPEYYGLPKNEELLIARLTKEAVHELGHTFGLIHCRDDRCVMHSSTYAEDIDLKSDSPCSTCLQQLFPASVIVVDRTSV